MHSLFPVGVFHLAYIMLLKFIHDVICYQWSTPFPCSAVFHCMTDYTPFGATVKYDLCPRWECGGLSRATICGYTGPTCSPHSTSTGHNPLWTGPLELCQLISLGAKAIKNVFAFLCLIYQKKKERKEKIFAPYGSFFSDICRQYLCHH